MKGKVIKEQSDERWRGKRILKEISKKHQNKKDYFTQKMNLKNHKRREKEEKKKQEEKKKVSLQLVGKTNIFLDTSKQESRKGEPFFFFSKKEWKRKPKKRVTKKNEKLFFKTQENDKTRTNKM